MTGPAPDPTGPVSMTLDEIGTQIKTIEGNPKPADLTQIKLEGDDVSPLLKGKTVAEALKIASGLEQGLKLSEDARKQAETLAQSMANRPASVAEPPKPVEEPEMNQEQLDQLFETDRVKAIEYITQRSIKKAEDQVTRRLQPLFTGQMVAAETGARAQFATEFTLFGDEIQKVIEAMPDRSALSNPKAWSDLVSWVRGKPGNIEKYMTHMNNSNAAIAAAAARATQAASTGYSATGESTRSAPPVGASSLDATEREIARVMGIPDADWAKWKGVK